MGGRKINIFIGISILALSACITLHNDVYKSSSNKYVIFLNDSTFVFWADSPLMFGEQDNRYADGNYIIRDDSIILNSKVNEIRDSFEIEQSVNCNLLIDSCRSFLITIKFLRSLYRVPTRINLIFPCEDSISISSFSDSIILLQCMNDSSAKRLSNEITIYYIPSKIKFQKLVFGYLDKSHTCFLSDSINHLNITVYEKKYDTLEFRVFDNEKWKLGHNRLIDPINKEKYILWKQRSQDQKNVKLFYSDLIKQIYLRNKKYKQ